jgi:CBS domain-containing protein
MRSVVELLKKKETDIWSVAPDTPVYKALELMFEKNCGAGLVLEKEKLVGILSERDYARKVILKGKSSKNTPVAEIMSLEVVQPFGACSYRSDARGNDHQYYRGLCDSAIC